MPNHLASGRPIQILLVEDSPGDVRLTVEALRGAKVPNRLNVVDDGVKAMAYLRREGPYVHAPRPDVILLDLNLPKMDGREVLSKLKHDAALKSIPIIVLTTSTAEEDILRSYDLHANCYITKPSDLDQFITALQAIEAFWFSVVTLPPNDETHHGEQSDQLPHGKTPRSQDA